MLYNCLKEGCSQLGIGLLSQTVSIGRGTWPQAELGEVQFGHRSNLFTERVVEHWKKLCREVVGSWSLKVFKKCLDVVLSIVI